MPDEKILIVDDNENILEVIRMRLESVGYEVSTAANACDALGLVKGGPFDLVITDLKMTERNGIQLMEDVQLVNPEIPVIILTAHGSIENAVEAMKKGAYSYLTKPFNDNDLALHVKKALEKQSLTREIKRLRQDLLEKYHLENIVGKSPAMQLVFEQIIKVAPSPSTVLILGESGTGKEMIAKAIHYNSPRANQPFLAVNCSALPETLLENELFGHIKGAYTGATDDRDGLFMAANGGTLFLDEIADAPLTTQVKLLRALQEREILPVGGHAPRKVDVRLIVATNKDLKKSIEEGTFREDLYYRIHVIPVSLPPLRERKEDVPLLADHFLQKYAIQMNKEIQGFKPEALQRMMLYEWPGNVRELEHRIEHAVVMAAENYISPEDLFPSRREEPGGFKTIREAREEFEEEYVRNLLRITKGNVSTAAKLAGHQRIALYNLIKKYGINLDEFRS
ncbi:MAG: sigma-54-dependent Fis family transcriptional regulator [Nitrospirae bacterium]|nr:sigma-54-dependent Fis family transcriptional regulator [Nitrospirota bacterium]MBI3392214.1 sigma-54-dependent Fis family transcriptional regulator [Nitrospirota bacterium]